MLSVKLHIYHTLYLTPVNMKYNPDLREPSFDFNISAFLLITYKCYYGFNNCQTIQGH